MPLERNNSAVPEVCLGRKRGIMALLHVRGLATTADRPRGHKTNLIDSQRSLSFASNNYAPDKALCIELFWNE
jgi:hypothetical protein